ncbi:MAG: trypsin-like peptidase domain-containing protein [Capsulimonadaceae bacterium]
MKNLFILLLVLTLAIAPMAARADETAAQVQTLLDKQSPSIVTVKVVIKTQFQMAGQTQDSESRLELQGTVVTPDGLIMLNNAPFDNKSLSDMLGTSADSSEFHVKTTPTEFKVVVGNEDKEYSAFLAGSDPNLGLAFVKMQDLGDRTLQPVDFSSTDTPAIGDRVFAVSRLSKGYDYAPYLSAGWVYGQISKPQQAWVVNGAGDVGLPVFTDSGIVLGCMATVSSGVKDTQSGGDEMGMGMLMRMFGGGASDHTSAFLVPSSVFTNVVALAKQQAVTVAARLAKDNATTAPAKEAPPAPAPAAGSTPSTTK